MIRGAAAGPGEAREAFARRYVAVVRAYLAHRWKHSRMIGEIDDVVQEVFMECFRQGGVLDRIREVEPSSFRAFLYGVTRNVALRAERRIGRRSQRQRPGGLDSDQVVSDDASLSRVFDQAWARALLRHAGQLQEERAVESGGSARTRVELLRLRARENLPIREIARRWNEDPARLHKEYARARREFREALVDLLAFHYPGSTAAEIDQRCADLLELLRG